MDFQKRRWIFLWSLGIFLFFLGTKIALKILCTGLIAFAIELSVQKIIKHAIRRLRPIKVLANISVLIVPPDEYSFPSGHTTAAFLISILFGVLIPGLLLPLLFYASLVGFSRIYLGVHYLTDVLVGIVLGILYAQIGIALIV